MPPRPARGGRLVSNENDENSVANATRMTRAKAAALNVDELAMPTKAALQPKKALAAAGTTNVMRKRGALEDVSNRNKHESLEGKKVGVKASVLAPKGDKPAGVQKNTIRPNSRLAPNTRELKKPVETKRGVSGSGALAGSQKRKATTTVSRDAAVNEEVGPRKRLHVNDTEKQARSSSTLDKENEGQAQTETQATEAPEASTERPRWKDLDTEDQDDPLMVADYANEIFDYLRDLEPNCLPNENYMEHQDDLEWKTRGILIDWLIEVHTRFHLLPETLFLAVNIIDRFLSQKVVQLDRLQLVGITAMFIASKYEEVLSPHVENFKRIADDGFSEAEILSAERFILTTLNYDLSYPNPMNFLRRVSKADNYDIQSRTIGKYLMEISLLDHRFLEHAPSKVAAGAMYLARLMLDREYWDETLSHYAGYTEDEVQPVVQLMVDYCARGVVHEAFFKKYASKKFMKASIIARNWSKHNADVFQIPDLHLTLDQL